MPASTQQMTVTIIKIFLSSLIAAMFLAVTPATAQNVVTPECQLPESDLDGDGWGWENNESCIVAGSTAAAAATSQSSSTTNICQYASSDEDGDGWGWENNDSCTVGPTTSTEEPNTVTTPFVAVLDTRGRTVCQSPNADPDGDGYGWENNDSCIVAGSAVEATPAQPANPLCTTSDADPDGDGWGWENGDSCIVSARGTELVTERISNTNTANTNTANTDPVTNIDTATDSGIDMSNDSEAGTDTIADVNTDTETVANTIVDAGNNIETVSETTIDTNNNTETDADTAIDTSNTEPVTDTIADTSNNADPGIVTTTDTDIEAGIDAVIPRRPPFLPQDITDLILVTGQSNTLGSNSTFDTTLDAPHPRVFAYTSEGWQVAELYQSWDNGAHPGTGNREDISKIHNNFALHFGKRLADLDENAVIGFLLVSEPGEGIDHWAPGAAGMLRVQQKTIAAINELPHKSALDGILWHQGETDWLLEGTSDPDVNQPAPIDYYPVRLSALINNLRTENWYDNTKPFICGETINAVGVNTHLFNLNSDSDNTTACVEGAGLPAIRESGNHFNASALRTIGSRYADTYFLMR